MQLCLVHSVHFGTSCLQSNTGLLMMSTECLVAGCATEGMSSVALGSWEVELVDVWYLTMQLSETGSSALNISNMPSNTWEVFARAQKAINTLPKSGFVIYIIQNTWNGIRTILCMPAHIQVLLSTFLIHHSSLTYRHPLLLLLAWPQTLAQRDHSPLPATALSALFSCLVWSAMRVGG